MASDGSVCASGYAMASIAAVESANAITNYLGVANDTFVYLSE